MISSLFTLLDDIVVVLDDVAAMTKVAAKKTAGIVGDDLAVNANQVAGVNADRELPVIWAVAKGSLINKVVIVPAALLLSSYAPFVIAPLLAAGGLYLCFEGAEKVWHWSSTKWGGQAHARAEKADDGLSVAEASKIQGAIRTDAILSLEIVVIALGAMMTLPVLQRSIALGLVALGMTVLVYGLVAIIIKLDDVGLHLARTGSSPWVRTSGQRLVEAAPHIMRTLTVVGTIAMCTVGGGILAHHLPSPVVVQDILAGVATFSPWLSGLVEMLSQTAIGLAAGGLAMAAHASVTKALGRAH